MFMWARQGSNLRPIGYEPTALTTELRAPVLQTDKLGIIDYYNSARDL